MRITGTRIVVLLLIVGTVWGIGSFIESASRWVEDGDDTLAHRPGDTSSSASADPDRSNITARDSRSATEEMELPTNPLEALEQLKVLYSEAEFVRRSGSYGPQDTRIVRLFLDAGMNPNTEDSTGLSALERAVKAGILENVLVLLDKDANVNKQDQRGWPVLMQAVERISSQTPEKIVELLIDHGADASFRSPGGVTALAIAAHSNSAATVQMLLDHGADPNARDDTNSETPLISAAYIGNEGTLKVLLDRGADINAENNEGLTALKLARAHNQKHIVKILKEAGAHDFEVD